MGLQGEATCGFACVRGMRTKHPNRRCCKTFPAVQRRDKTTITASDRTCQRIAAPILLPESDTVAPATGRAVQVATRLALASEVDQHLAEVGIRPAGRVDGLLDELLTPILLTEEVQHRIPVECGGDGRP